MRMEIGQNYSQVLKGYQKELTDYQALNPFKTADTNEKNTQNFDGVLTSALDTLSTKTSKVSGNTTNLITGDLDNIHTLMIDMSEAQLTLQTAIQVRNKCIEAYNEIKNMQF